MSQFRAGDVKLLVWTVCIVTVLAVLAACGVSYGHASRTAQEYEQRIASTKIIVAGADQRLLDTFTQLMDSPYLTLTQAKYIAKSSQKFGGQRGKRIAALELKKASYSRVEVTPLLINNVSSAIKAYQVEETRQRQQLSGLQKSYKDELDSFWTGFWMKRAGFPSAETFKPVKPLNVRAPIIITSPGRK